MWLPGTSWTGRAEQRGQLALLARRDEVVAGGHDHGAAVSHAAEPRACVVAPELAAGLGDVVGVAARELARGPARARVVGKPEAAAQPAAPHAVAEQPELEAQQDHDPPRAAHVRLLPVGRRRAQHEPVDEVGVVAREQAGDRTAHRVADDEHAVDALGAHDGGGVLGAGAQAEGLRRAHPAAVAAVVEREDAEARLAQRSVHRDPVEVGADHPAVQEQHGGPVAAAVAQHELAAARDADDARRRQAGGRRRRARVLGAQRGALAHHGGQRARPHLHFA